MLAALCSILLNGAPNEYEGKPIASVQFDPVVQPLTFDQLMAMLPLRIGQPLRASDLRDSIQRLYQTGEYCRHRRGRHPRAGRSEPEVHHQARVFHWILRRERRCASRPTKVSCWWPPSSLSAAPYVPSDTTAAVARITDLLKRNGFYNAGVEPATSTREPTQEVHIDFHGDAGERAKFDGLVADWRYPAPPQ